MRAARRLAAFGCFHATALLWEGTICSLTFTSCAVSPSIPQVGGRSVVNKDIAQFIEIRPEEERFLRLLEVLGEW